MGILEHIADLNPWAVAVATVAFFVIGGLWYSPLMFAGPWQRAAGLSDDDLAGRNMVAVFGLTLVAALASSLTLGLILVGTTDWLDGAVTGLACGIGLAAAAQVTVGLFEGRPARLMAITGGYYAVALTVAGAVLGAW